MPDWVKQKYYLIKSPFEVLDAKPLTTTLVTYWNELVKREDDSIMPFATLSFASSLWACNIFHVLLMKITPLYHPLTLSLAWALPAH